MHQIWALARKDLLLLLRDKSGLFFTFAFPVGFALFFGMIFGGGGGVQSAKIAVAVVDSDRTESSAKFVKRLTGSDNLAVTEAPGSDAAGRPVDALAWAELRVLGRHDVAFIHIKPGFGKGQEELFAGGQSAIEVGADPSKAAERGMLEGILQQHAYAGLSDAFAKPAQGRKQAARARELARANPDMKPADRLLFETFFGALDSFLAGAERRNAEQPGAEQPSAEPAPGNSGGFAFTPVRITFADVRPKRVGPSNAFAVSFPQGLVWGVMGAAMGFAVSFIGERRSGTYARLACSPMAPWKLIAGKSLACLLTIVLAMSLMLALAALLGVSLANWPTLAVAAGVVAFAFVGIMALISVVAPTERAASGLGWAVMMVLAFVGGAAVPTFVMPGWMQAVSNVSPMAWAMACLEGGVWRGASVADLWKPLLALSVLGIAGLSTAVYSLRRAR